MTINDHLKATDIVIFLDSNLDFEDGVILIKIGALFDQLSWRIKDIPSVFMFWTIFKDVVIIYNIDSNLDFEDGVFLIKIGALFDQISWRIKDILFCIHVLDHI